MEIKVLGTGCAKCNELEEAVKEVVRETGSAATVVKVSDISEIVKAGVMLTPALVIDGDVRFSGKLPSKAELTAVIIGAGKKGN